MSELDQVCINTIRFLAVDMVEKAARGHPGLPMGAAPMAYVLWTRFLHHNPADPLWFDRDRFVLSAGHGCALLYALLHLTGYDLPIEQLQSFRQWGSRTPGHPERGHTPGVEVTTGPLGQGFANAVGEAIAEAHLAARFNRLGLEPIDHHTYVIASDGDLMEGIGSEAASLAGRLKLGKLICLYDDNRVMLSGSTDITFDEDRVERFKAYGGHVQALHDGNDLDAIDSAIAAARDQRERPSLIAVRTHIGYGAPHVQDTFHAHGSPLGADEVRGAKKNLGGPRSLRSGSRRRRAITCARRSRMVHRPRPRGTSIASRGKRPSLPSHPSCNPCCATSFPMAGPRTSRSFLLTPRGWRRARPRAR